MKFRRAFGGLREIEDITDADAEAGVGADELDKFADCPAVGREAPRRSPLDDAGRSLSRRGGEGRVAVKAFVQRLRGEASGQMEVRRDA